MRSLEKQLGSSDFLEPKSLEKTGGPSGPDFHQNPWDSMEIGPKIHGKVLKKTGVPESVSNLGAASFFSRLPIVLTTPHASTLVEEPQGGGRDGGPVSG